MTNDLKLVSGHLTRFWPAAISSPWLAGWSGGLSTSRRPQHPPPPPPCSRPPLLLCSLLTVAATVPERPRPAPEDKRRQQMEKPPKLLISLANLGTASFPGLSPSPSFSFNHLSTLTLFIQNCFQKAKASLAKKMKVV